MRSCENLNKRLYNEILHQIRNGEYPTGSRLPSEKQMQEQYGVSRNTLRIVLKKMNAAGILETKRGSGTYVRNFHMQNGAIDISPTALMSTSGLVDLMGLRQTLEVSAAYWAAINATEEELVALDKAFLKLSSYKGSSREMFSENAINFHSLLVNASHNTALISLMDLVLNLSAPELNDFIAANGVDQESNYYHKMILLCVKAKKADEAEFMMRMHMRKLLRQVQEYIDNKNR